MKGPDLKTASMRSFGPRSSDPGGPGKRHRFMTGELDARPGLPRRGQAHEQTVASLRLLWESRSVPGARDRCWLVPSALVVALLIPSRYQSVARLMPPDNQSGSRPCHGRGGAFRGRCGMGGLGGMAGELLGLKSTSDLLVGVLSSRTVEDKLIQKFDLRKVYGTAGWRMRARHLAARTDISVDRKSQIITITVTDKSPQRAAAMAQAYVGRTEPHVGRGEHVFSAPRADFPGRTFASRQPGFGGCREGV